MSAKDEPTVDVPSKDSDTDGSGNSEGHGRQSGKQRIIAFSVAGAALVAVVLLVAYLAGAFHQHVWNDPTCTEPKTCSECGAIDGEPLGHDYKSVHKDADCSHGAKTVYTCTRCGDSYDEPDGGEALGHDLKDWELDSSKSKMIQACMRCGITVHSRACERSDIDQAISTQEVRLDDIHKEVNSDPAHKYLYPDQIWLTITNDSNRVVRSVELLTCYWDANGYPISCPIRLDGNQDSAILTMSDINLAPGESWRSEDELRGFNLDGTETGKCASVRGIVRTVAYADGTQWVNPLVKIWESLYVSKQL